MNGMKCGTQMVSAGAIFVVFVILGGVCNAQVYQVDLNQPGDRLLAVDPQTNLEWLRLQGTSEQSLNDVLAGAGGWQDLGFRVATQAEVSVLWDRLGIVDIGSATQTNVAGVNRLHALLGACFSSELSMMYGMMLDKAQQPAMTLSQRINTNGFITASVEFIEPVDPDFQNECAGVYLVRSIPPDLDGDGLPNSQDNCVLTVNPRQRDTNGDGIGNFCDPDIDNSGNVGFVDYAVLTGSFGTQSDGDLDFNGDGAVSFPDIFIYASHFNMPPGPSGLL